MPGTVGVLEGVLDRRGNARVSICGLALLPLALASGVAELSAVSNVYRTWGLPPDPVDAAESRPRSPEKTEARSKTVPGNDDVSTPDSPAFARPERLAARPSRR